MSARRGLGSESSSSWNASIFSFSRRSRSSFFFPFFSFRFRESKTSCCEQRKQKNCSEASSLSLLTHQKFI